jgi:hypothetical protein
MSSITKDEQQPSHPDHAASTAPPNIDKITRDLHKLRIRLADIFYPRDNSVDPTPYSPAITSCVYDLLKDHRGTISAKAWISS